MLTPSLVTDRKPPLTLAVTSAVAGRDADLALLGEDAEQRDVTGQHADAHRRGCGPPPARPHPTRSPARERPPPPSLAWPGTDPAAAMTRPAVGGAARASSRPSDVSGRAPMVRWQSATSTVCAGGRAAARRRPGRRRVDRAGVVTASRISAGRAGASTVGDAARPTSTQRCAQPTVRHGQQRDGRRHMHRSSASAPTA